MSKPTVEHEVPAIQATSAARAEALRPQRDRQVPEAKGSSETPAGFQWLSRKQLHWLPLLVPLGALTLALGAAAIMTTA